jgi:hypothetical protein
MTSRRPARRHGSGASARTVALVATTLSTLLACDPRLGELPVRCGDGQCPAGYDCVHGVCAAPGTQVPATVADLESLRAVDLRLVPLGSSALVVWQTYAYSEAGQAFVGARVGSDGEPSAELELVSTFEADEGGLEPYYDLFDVGSGRLLLAVSAGPLPTDDDASPRLLTYRVDVPEAGNVSFATAWPAEERLGTVGFGAVSRPRFTRSAVGVELACVQSSSSVGATQAELVRYGLGEDGGLTGESDVDLVRAGASVAVGVSSAHPGPDGVFWMLDDERPSVAFDDGGGQLVELALPELALGLTADADGLLYLEPSARGGDELPSDPAEGPATLHRVRVSSDAMGVTLVDEVVGSLPVLRDTPQAAFVERPGTLDLLVTPGELQEAEELVVLTLDRATGVTAEVARVPRLSSNPVEAVRAVVVDGALLVVWLESSPASAIVRTVALPEP